MVKNAKIEKIGLCHFGHGNRSYIEMILNTGGGGLRLTVPLSHVDEIFETFRDTLDEVGNFEDGVFLEDLKGHIVQVKYDGEDSFQSRVVAIGEPLAEEDDFFYLKKERNNA